MSARGRLIFSEATPLRETTGNGGRTDVGMVAKQVVLGLTGQRKFLGKDGKMFSDRAETQRELDELQMCLEIIWAKTDPKRMAVLTDEGELGREATPDGENGELVPLTFDTRANEDLWNLLFLVCDGRPRQIVMEFKRDGRRVLQKLRCEYGLGHTEQSVEDLENQLHDLRVTGKDDPSEVLEQIVDAHNLLARSQVHRNDAGLQRALLRAVRGELYAPLCLSLRELIDSQEGLPTVEVQHRIHEYWEMVMPGTSGANPGVRVRLDGAAMPAADAEQQGFKCRKRCDVCKASGLYGMHFIRDCPAVIETVKNMEKAAAVAARGSHFADIGALQNFWDEEDGTTL